MNGVGVIGAGVMGRGVAQSLAEAGKTVVLLDISEDILTAAREELYRNIRFSSLFSKKPRTESIESILSRILFTTDYEMLREVDFVIENVPEQWDLKKAVYERIDGICPEHCIFAVNTSCISITKAAALTTRQDRVIGIHFMNPVPAKPVVEAIRGFYTSEETIAAAKALLADMDKEMILVNDMPGFVSNRLSHLLMNEAAFVVQDQVASPQDVDDIFRRCYNHAMGPLETADLIGIDTVVNSLDILYESYQDSKFRVCPLLRTMVHAGLHGRKSGRGFYEYPIVMAAAAGGNGA